jgi:sulfatase modifying factor 1
MSTQSQLFLLAVVFFFSSTGRGAEDFKKLKSQTVTLKVQFEHPDTFKTTPVNFEMLQLPAGKITLKDAHGKETEHKIKPIWMGKFEVRWDDYDPFWMFSDLDLKQRRDGIEAKSRPSRPYSPPDAGYGHDGYPAGGIHYVAARQYCEWLSAQTKKKFRLPTEAEWEYACRAGGPPVKLDAKSLDKFAWFMGNSKEEPHPVGQKQPNAWGFYDMLGNVAEFVVRDPSDKTRGVLAGGSYDANADKVNSDAREPYTDEWNKENPMTPPGVGWLPFVHRAGFRVVMED